MGGFFTFHVLYDRTSFYEGIFDVKMVTSDNVLSVACVALSSLTPTGQRSLQSYDDMSAEVKWVN